MTADLLSSEPISPAPVAGRPAGHHNPGLRLLEGGRGWDTGFGDLVAERVLAWQQPDRSESDLLDMIVAAAADLVAGAGAAAIVAVSGAAHMQVEVHATYDGFPAALGALRAIVHDHPGWDTIPARPLRSAGGKPTAGPWPVLTCPPGRDRPGSVICTPLAIGRSNLGTLLLISDHGTFTSDSALQATVVARHASVAVAAVRDRENLKAAVAHRDVIGQAKGILMERFKLTPAQAFAELVRISGTGNRKLHLICADLSETGDFPPSRGRT